MHAATDPQSRMQILALSRPRTRTLDEAAHAAQKIASAEHLPINTVSMGDDVQWHRESILTTVPVYGLRGAYKERVPASAHLEGDRATLDVGEWSDLTVRGSDFQRYLDWLHSIW